MAHIRAVLNCGGGSASKPLLVLSCVSREEPEAVRATSLQTVPSRPRSRTPCVDMAKRLGLPQLANPWMVIILYSCIAFKASITIHPRSVEKIFKLCVSLSCSGAEYSSRILVRAPGWHCLVAKVFWSQTLWYSSWSPNTCCCQMNLIHRAHYSVTLTHRVLDSTCTLNVHEG